MVKKLASYHRAHGEETLALPSDPLKRCFYVLSAHSIKSINKPNQTKALVKTDLNSLWFTGGAWILQGINQRSQKI